MIRIKKRIVYPTSDEIIQTNKDILSKLKVYKAEKFGLLAGRNPIEEVLKKVKRKSGDLYDKAVILLKELIIRHPFEVVIGELHILLLRNSY